MISISVAFLLSLVVAAFATPWVRQRALNWGAVDDPARARKVHTAVIPRLGGLAIAGGFFAALLTLLAFETGVARIFSEDVNRVVGLFGGAVAMLALGVYDDLLGADAKKKFLVQVAAALGLCALGFGFERISWPWGGALEIGLFGIPLTVFWIVGITNAINLIDGLDGLAAGVSLFAVITMCVVAAASGQVVGALITAALAGALVGFLFHNFHPATIFMGDTGSLFLGFVVAATGLMTSSKSTTTVALLIPVVALGLPILDTTLATFRRLLRGRSPFSADQEHMHHKLLKMGLTHRRAVLVLWGFCAVACAAAAGAVFAQGTASFYILGGFAVFALVMARSLGYLRIEDWGEEFRLGRTTSRLMRRRTRRIRALVRSFARIHTSEALFRKLSHAHKLQRYDSMTFEILDTPGRNDNELVVAQSFVWQRMSQATITTTDRSGRPPAVLPPPSATGEGFVEVAFGLNGRRGTLGRISYRYHAGRGRLDADEEALMLTLHEGLAKRLETILQASTGDAAQESNDSANLLVELPVRQERASNK